MVWNRLFTSLLVVSLITAPALAQERGSQQKSNSSSEKSKQAAGDYYVVEALNEGVPESSQPVDLSTPLATVENFIFACRDQDYEHAAQSLNFELIPKGQRNQAGELARKFYYALNQRL